MTTTPLHLIAEPEVTVADVVPIGRTFTFTTQHIRDTEYLSTGMSASDLLLDPTGWKPTSPTRGTFEYLGVNLHYRAPFHIRHIGRVYPKAHEDSVISIHTEIDRSWTVEFIQPQHLDAAIDAAQARLAGLLALRKQA